MITIEERSGLRWYRAGTSGLVPSVTTVISLCPDGIKRWPDAAIAAVEHARARGTELHRANALFAGAEHGLDLDWDSLDPEVRPRMEAIAGWKARRGWETIWVERPLIHSRFEFAGTPDEVGRFRGSDVIHVLDIKPKHAPLAGAQLSGYALLVRDAMHLPYAPGRTSLHVYGDRAVQHTLNDHARDRDAFLAALSWFHYCHGKGVW